MSSTKKAKQATEDSLSQFFDSTYSSFEEFAGTGDKIKFIQSINSLVNEVKIKLINIKKSAADTRE